LPRPFNAAGWRCSKQLGETTLCHVFTYLPWKS
jgi:hypothetical protein